MDFAIPADHKVKLKKVKSKLSTWTLLENWKTMEHESNGETNCYWCAWYSHQRIDNGIGGLGNERTNGDHPNNSIIKMDQNTEKSLGDVSRFAVAQIPVEDHWLMLVRKTLEEVIIMIITIIKNRFSNYFPNKEALKYC